MGIQGSGGLPSIGEVRRAFRGSLELDDKLGYVRRTLGHKQIAATYKVRGIQMELNHRTLDIAVLNEVFCAKVYALPAALTGEFKGKIDLRILDLGGHIGMFGAWAATQFPGASLTAYEPDPTNAARYRKLIADNGLAWQLNEACAGVQAGQTSFIGGDSAQSRQSDDGDIVVSILDAMSDVVDADFIKLDIEGGEWAIMTDPRFKQLTCKALIMEYHEHLCPADDPRKFATQILEDLGFTVEHIFEDDQGFGMLRALRS